jgi:hypothetical protein
MDVCWVSLAIGEVVHLQRAREIKRRYVTSDSRVISHVCVWRYIVRPGCQSNHTNTKRPLIIYVG